MGFLSGEGSLWLGKLLKAKTRDVRSATHALRTAVRLMLGNVKNSDQKLTYYRNRGFYSRVVGFCGQGTNIRMMFGH